jgi:O-antigen ligase
VIGGMLAIVVLGLALNKSLAGLGLGLPVLIASAVLLVEPRRQRRWLIVPATLLVVAVGIILALPLSGKFESLDAGSSVESRRVVGTTSWQAFTDFAPVGSGLGTFEKVYRLYEDPAAVDRTFVNHAHNDYLEIAVEMGIPGLIAVLLFLTWWAIAAARQWRTNANDPFAKAATIASAAILAHSLVDFPLRTAAISALFAGCISLLVGIKVRAVSAGRPDLWQSRHLEIR